MDIFEFDKKYRLNHPILLGTDEAGRGPLAGPVFAASVVFENECYIKGLNDSKQIKEEKRNDLFEEIIQKAKAYHISFVDVNEIENINILNASKNAMIDSINKINLEINMVLIDGNQKLNINYNQECIIKGDSKSASIAAASILAKVSRDRVMLEYDKIYPEYGFASHKGYATLSHRGAILKYGPCPIHRPSFLRKLLSEKNQMELF